MKKYVLLTGATGLVGRYLLRDLLTAGHRVAVVARHSEKQTAVDRIESIMQMWEAETDSNLPRPVVLEGDITQPGFGLSHRDEEWIAVHCDKILNNAAVITFYGTDRAGEPWRTNVEGTRNALELCERTGIREFHHVSTAYISGTRTGVIREDELDCGQSFRNDYEESKFLAEKLVRESTFLRSLTVYRPAIIAGDSQTGYTSTYHGLYHHLKLMSVVARNVEPDENGVRYTPIQIPMTGDEPRNIVPVDWVSAITCRIFADPSLHGRTYHLAPKRRITVGEVMDAACQFYNSMGVEFTGKTASEPKPDDIYPSVQESIRLYAPYEETDPTFDISNVESYVADLPCPDMNMEMVIRFLKFGEKDRWGKRRVPPPTVPFSVGKFLAEELSRHHPEPVAGEPRNSTETSIGLNVYGPGGGQWCLGFAGQRLKSVVAGLPSDRPCVSLATADFSRLVHKDECLTADSLQRFVDENASQQIKPISTISSLERPAYIANSAEVEYSLAGRRPLGEKA